MRRLLEHVIEMPEDLLPALSLQDAALCHMCRIDGVAALQPVAGFDRLESRIAQWLAVARPIGTWSEARRTQTLLRELIDRVEADGAESLTRDELDLLETVFAFSLSVQAAESFAQIRELISPHRDRIEARRSELAPAVGLPTLSTRYLVIRPEDILQAPQREVRVLAGVQLPARGPVLVHSGHVRVLGDVPDGATLVVEQADCVVDGFVLGRVAVSGHCEVLDNVSGVVIARNGNVRARNIVDNAFVVSKRGEVCCRRALGATMIFAGDTLRVTETLARSVVCAPTVHVEDCAQSGRIHASSRIDAGRLGSGDGALSLFLRSGLSCRDYGEDPGRAMAADVSRALRARGALQWVRSQMSLTLLGAEQSAETSLMYLLAAEGAARTAEEICAAQRRLDVLSRILLALRAVYSEAEAQTDDEDSGDTEADAPNPTALDRIDAEIATLVDDVPGGDAARVMYADLSDARGKIEHRQNKRSLQNSALQDIRGKIERWNAEAETLREAIRRGQEKLAHGGRVKEILSGEAGSKSKILTLQRILERVRNEAPDSKLRARAGSAFITTMSRAIEKRLADAKKLKSELESARDEFDAARTHVWNEYQMRINDEDGFDHAIVVEGAIDGTVKMFADSRFNCDPRSELSDDQAVVASPSKGERVCYVCSGGRIRRQKPAADYPERTKLALSPA